jgi:hypothetical protein
MMASNLPARIFRSESTGFLDQAAPEQAGQLAFDDQHQQRAMRQALAQSVQ